MDKVKKILILVILIFTVVGFCSSGVLAASGDDGGEDLSGGTGGANFDFNSFDAEVSEVEKVNKFVDNAAGTTITIARIVCVAIAIVMLLVIAMKYMISAPGDRADIKKHAINYVIGACVLFGVSGILTILNEVAKSIK